MPGVGKERALYIYIYTYIYIYALVLKQTHTLA